MKSKTLTNLFVLGCFAALFFSCGGNNTTKMLVKKWQFESLKSDAMDKQMAALKQQIDTTRDSATKAMMQGSMKMMTEGMESMKGVTMEFKADGTAESSMGGSAGSSEKSNWSLTSDCKKLIVARDGGKKTDTMDITELTQDKLVLGMGGPQGGGAMTWSAVK
jgi:hypothetical protein